MLFLSQLHNSVIWFTSRTSRDDPSVGRLGRRMSTSTYIFLAPSLNVQLWHLAGWCSLSSLWITTRQAAPTFLFGIFEMLAKHLPHEIEVEGILKIPQWMFANIGVILTA